MLTTIFVRSICTLYVKFSLNYRSVRYPRKRNEEVQCVKRRKVNAINVNKTCIVAVTLTLCFVNFLLVRILHCVYNWMVALSPKCQLQDVLLFPAYEAELRYRGPFH